MTTQGVALGNTRGRSPCGLGACKTSADRRPSPAVPRCHCPLGGATWTAVFLAGQAPTPAAAVWSWGTVADTLANEATRQDASGCPRDCPGRFAGRHRGSSRRRSLRLVGRQGEGKWHG
jgi:hypothetical protein